MTNPLYVIVKENSFGRELWDNADNKPKTQKDSCQKLADIMNGKERIFAGPNEMRYRYWVAELVEI